MRLTQTERKTRDRIEWLQVQLRAQARQMDHTDDEATLANIRSQMAEDRDTLDRLRRIV